MNRTILALCLLGGVFWCTVAFALPGDLDGTFGLGGLAAYDFFGGSTDRFVALAVQLDRKIVAVGSTATIYPVNFDFAVLRLLPDGTPDPGFGSAGRVRTDILSGHSDGASAVAIQPDHKIIVAGGTDVSVSVLRLLPDGTLDSLFATGGKLNFQIPGCTEASVTGIVVRPTNGKILLSGFATPAYTSFAAFVLQLRADGTLDRPSDHRPVFAVFEMDANDDH